MSHISYFELKDWNFCSFYHKITRINKIDGFKGNEYTAFGTAMHSVCEKKLLKEDVDDEQYFLDTFSECISDLPDDVKVDSGLIDQMVGQGKRLVPHIEAAMHDYFEEFEVLGSEIELYEPIENENHSFKGFIDAVVTTPDGKIHIFDWKTCSWGWNARRRAEPMTTYQLTLYKHFFCQKMNIDPKNVETHFALLKRTAKNNHIEFFRVTSGPVKTKNVLKLLSIALYNIKNQRYIKNRLSCTSGYGCKFYKTEHCP